MLLPNPLEVKPNVSIQALYVFNHFVWCDLQKPEAATASKLLERLLWSGALATHLGCVFGVSSCPAFLSPLSALGGSNLEVEGEDKWRLK